MYQLLFFLPLLTLCLADLMHRSSNFIVFKFWDSIFDFFAYLFNDFYRFFQIISISSFISLNILDNFNVFDGSYLWIILYLFLHFFRLNIRASFPYIPYGVLSICINSLQYYICVDIPWGYTQPWSKYYSSRRIHISLQVVWQWA